MFDMKSTLMFDMKRPTLGVILGESFELSHASVCIDSLFETSTKMATLVHELILKKTYI
jgi:hypothetical protein